MREISLIGFAGALFLSGAAAAQDAGRPEAERGETAHAIEEVIVTARRRSERLQEAPISVTAFTAASLERLGVDDVADIALRTPGMQYGNFGDVKLSPTTLRGVIAASSSAGADPAVGYYVDEIFVGQGASANLDLFDVAQVEILRGPQGTLFGRNTIAGVVSITTQRPDDTFRASLSADLGDYGHRRVGGSVGGPLAEGVAGKLAFVSASRDGLSRNMIHGDDVNTLGSWSTRGQLLFDRGEASSLLLTAEYRQIDQAPLVYETLRYNEATTFAALMNARGLERNADPYDRRVYTDTRPREELEGWGLSAIYKREIGEIGFTSISAYRTHSYYNRSDTDRSALSMLYDGDPEDVWSIAQEFKLDGRFGDFTWLAGAYYFRQHTDNQAFVEVGADLAALVGDISLAGFMAGSSAQLDTESLAAFASTTWSVTPALDITLGGRFTNDRKRIDYVQTDPLGILGGDGAVAASNSWSEITPNLSLRYRFTPDVIAYGTASRGFKSGGYNDALGDANGIAFGPETLWNYEAGVKSNLFDRRLTLNIAAFYMDWSDIQITQDDPATPIYDPIILNAGAAHSRGVEIEAVAMPTDRLRLGLSYSLQEAEFDEGLLPTGAPLRVIPFSPRYTLSLNGDYTWSLDNLGDLTLAVDYVRRGVTYLSYDNIDDGKVEPYGLVNARLSFQLPSANWRMALWVENITDKTYPVRMFDLYDQDFVGQRFLILAEPRTFGVEFKVKY